MPYNGSGTFSRLYSWIVDAANSVNISSTRTDAEMNGFAAGLTNCITRDGQSPPSADIPMGGKKLVNLGTATVGTDALNMATGDARYLTSAGGTITGNLTITGNETVSGVASAVGVQVRYNAGISKAILQFTDAAGTVQLGSLETTNASVFTLNCTSLNVAGVLKQGGNQVWDAGSLTAAALNTIYGYTPTSPTSLSAALVPYALLASPPLSGTPTAPTAAIGTNTTQIATTAFVQAARPPIGQTTTSSATVTPTFNDDFVEITAQAAGLTLANPTGTAVNMWGIAVRIKDNATPQTIAFGTQYRGVGVTLPTTTVASKTLVLGMIFNNVLTKWDVVSVAQE